MQSTKRRLKWVNIIWLVGSALAVVVLVPMHLVTAGFEWKWLALFGVLATASGMSITAGYHRYLAHRSYEACLPLKLLYLFVGAGAFQGSALQWGTDHRRHHREVDTDKDPYNINKGLLWAHIGWLFFHEDVVYAGKFPPDLATDKWLRLQDKYYLFFAIASGFLLPMGIGYLMGSVIAGLIWGGVFRIVVAQQITFCINSLAHYLGTRPYSLKNSARDSLFMAVLAWGEGYHNYHHRFQADYRNGFRWYEWDPTKWMIRGLSFLGFTRNLKTVPDPIVLAARMQVDQANLAAQGVPTERLVALRARVDEAHARFRAAYADYRGQLRSMEANSRRRVLQYKVELKLARMEFKMACAQWYAYIRTAKALPAVA